MTSPATAPAAPDVLCIDCGEAGRSRLISDISSLARELGGAVETMPVPGSREGLRIRLPAAAIARMRAGLHLIGAASIAPLLADHCSGLLVLLGPSDQLPTEDKSL